MKKTILLLAVASVLPALACAKKPVKTVESTPQPVVEEPEEPVITEECLGNLSLFNEFCKSKQYADAYEPWLEVYMTCPNANKVIYSKGADLLEWKYNNAASDEEKAKVVELIMQMYDKRIKYFGDDPKYPTAYILGLKAMDYYKYNPDDLLNKDAYSWLKKSVEEWGAKSQLSALAQLAVVSTAMFKADPDNLTDQYMADYQMVSALLQQIWDDPASPNATAAAQQKEYVDGLFASSGAASCDKMNELYKDYVKTNGQYLEDMLKMMKLFRSVGCTESEIYFEAALAAHKLQPTAESAAGCAQMCMKKKDWEGALRYYGQAITLLGENADNDRCDYYYNMAYILMDKQHRYPEARNMARKSMDANPSQSGRCYLLIGLCYASTHPYSASADCPAAKAAILNKTVYWAAVDQFNKAAKYPSCAADAKRLAAQYSRYFPTREEIFDLQVVLGQIGSPFTVGGWIGEQTTCRASN